MNRSNRFTLACLLGLGLFTCNPGWAANTPNNQGNLVIRNYDGDICTLPVPPPGQHTTFDFSAQDPICPNNQTFSMEIVGMPSATTILMTDNAKCDKDFNNSGGEFWLELRTTRKTTTSTKVREIAYVASTPIGAIVDPGILLTGLEKIKDEVIFRDKVSCVKITASGKPPATAQ